MLALVTSVNAPVPSSVTSPVPFRLPLTDGDNVAAENVPDNDPFEKPAGGTDWGSAKPNPALAA